MICEISLETHFGKPSQVIYLKEASCEFYPVSKTVCVTYNEDGGSCAKFRRSCRFNHGYCWFT